MLHKHDRYCNEAYAGPSTEGACAMKTWCAWLQVEAQLEEAGEVSSSAHALGTQADVIESGMADSASATLAPAEDSEAPEHSQAGLNAATHDSIAGSLQQTVAPQDAGIVGSQRQQAHMHDDSEL